MGDFNQVVECSEKQGGRRPTRSSMSAMRRVIDNCGLIDMGFEGPKFT